MNNGLQINSKKSKCLVISKKEINATMQMLRVDTDEIKHVSQANNLGIVFRGPTILIIWLVRLIVNYGK